MDRKKRESNIRLSESIRFGLMSTLRKITDSGYHSLLHSKWDELPDPQLFNRMAKDFMTVL